MAVLSKEGFLIGKVISVNDLSAKVKLIKNQILEVKSRLLLMEKMTPSEPSKDTIIKQMNLS